MTVDSTAATAHAAADSSFGRSGRSTGTASTDESDLADERGDGPADSGRVGTPPPLHREGTGGDQQGAVHDGPGGAAAVQRGTSTATTTGAQPTKTPGTAGSAVRSAARTARLKPTMPTAASRASLPHRWPVRPRSLAAAPRPTRSDSSRQARP